MRILISGSSGLIGRALTTHLRDAHHEVLRLVRRSARHDDEVSVADLSPAHLEDVDAIINLAGEPVAQRWTARTRESILASRVDRTRTLVDLLAQTSARPKTLLNASAVGWYGDGGDKILSEDSPSGSGFLAQVCREWEAEAMRAEDHGVRVATMRFGVVLAREGGAIAKMLLPFQMGFGGKLGDGKQWMSWISLDDVVGGTLWLLEHPELKGPINFTAPHPEPNSAFTAALGKALKRPTLLPAPAFGLRWVLGEMAEEMLLKGQRVEPGRLLQSGYPFRHANLDAALAATLG
jgi:uncharacterized protein